MKAGRSKRSKFEYQIDFVQPIAIVRAVNSSENMINGLVCLDAKNQNTERKWENFGLMFCTRQIDLWIFKYHSKTVLQINCLSVSTNIFGAWVIKPRKTVIKNQVPYCVFIFFFFCSCFAVVDFFLWFWFFVQKTKNIPEAILYRRNDDFVSN